MASSASSVVRATVRAVSKRKIQATRAALTLVSVAAAAGGSAQPAGCPVSPGWGEELRHGRAGLPGLCRPLRGRCCAAAAGPPVTSGRDGEGPPGLFARSAVLPARAGAAAWGRAGGGTRPGRCRGRGPAPLALGGCQLRAAAGLAPQDRAAGRRPLRELPWGLRRRADPAGDKGPRLRAQQPLRAAGGNGSAVPAGLFAQPRKKCVS